MMTEFPAHMALGKKQLRIRHSVQIQNGNITINYDPHTTAQPILPRLAE